MVNVQEVDGNLIITGRVDPTQMELPFVQRLDNVRRLETMIHNPARLQHVPFSSERVTGLELVLEISSYVKAYNHGIVGRFDRNRLLPGDLTYRAEDDGMFELQLLHGAKVVIDVSDHESVSLQLECENPSAEALIHCAEVFVHLTSLPMSPRDLDY